MVENKYNEGKDINMSVQMMLTIDVKAGWDDIIYDEIKQSVKRHLIQTSTIFSMRGGSNIYIISDFSETFLDLATILQNMDAVNDTALKIINIKYYNKNTIEGINHCAINFVTDQHLQKESLLKQLIKIGKKRDWSIRMIGWTYEFETDGFIWVSSDEDAADIEKIIRNEVALIIGTNTHILNKIDKI